MLTVFFVILVTFAMFSVWDDLNTRSVGIALALCFVLANFLQFLQFDAQVIAFDGRVLLLCIGQAGLASMAFMSRMFRGPRSMVLVVVVAIVCVCANLAILMVPQEAMTLEIKHMWNKVTNICFVATCLILGTSGLFNRVRKNRLRNRPNLPRLFVARVDVQDGDG